MSLFQKSVIKKYLSNLDPKEVTAAYNKFKEFYGDSERIENIKLLKEENYQEGFLREIFVQVLGYTINPDKNYNLTTEFKNETDSKKADGAILQDGNAIGVIELKSTKTVNLELITTQAFNYKNHQNKCRFVITSNFEKLNFYIDNATEWEEFNLFSLTENDFKLFYFLLNCKNILSGIPLKVKEESRLHEENISDKLYKDYSQFKHRIYNNLVKNNPQFDKLSLFKSSQKLLDRILFILFAEDSLLVPPNSITRIVDQWKQLKSLDEAKPLYTRFVKFFNHLNVGHTYEEYSLPAYNGGLFQEDEILDNVKIDDEILLTDIIKLSSYDFSSEVDVNILGHIFEHSLSEIEELTAELEGNLVEREKSKRKKDGIFYTPKYITKYIVDNTIGSLCTEKKKELNLDEIDETILESSRTQKGKLNQKAKILFDNLDKYREYILSLKILDPACGSGAFLNQALEFLIKEHKWIDEHKSSLLKEAFTISEYEKEIVEKNIYGVDINEEAVEIAKLSLWLRTAKKGRKLSTLSNNIKCGNSLIDDPKVAGNKAFNWNEEFKEIMSNGGFDVVIGNPPYLNMTRNNIDKGWLHYFIKNYVSIKKSNSKNIFTLFIEKGIQLLRNNKNLSFIIPEGFLKTRSYNECLDYTKLNGSIISSVYFDSFVFKDAVTGSLIINFKKRIFNSENSIINYLNGQFIEYLNEKDKVLEKVLSNNFKTLSEIGKLFKGMVVKDRDSVLFKNFISSAKTNDKFLLGSNINRYRINSFWYCNYKELEIIGGTKLKTKYDIYPRILIRRTGDSLCSVLLKEKALTESTLYSFYIEKNEYDYFFVLGILNSKIATYIIRKEMITNKQAFPQILMTDLEKFVIPNVNQFIKTKIENLVKKILEYQNKLSSLFSNYFSRIESNLTINKFTNAIKEFNKYDFKTFVIELKKQKIELTLKKQDEWEEYFNEYKTKINQLQEEITKTDNEIDVMVYKLYNLTYEEVKIVDPQFWMREEVYNQFEISKTELK